jgi:hypothetical protein
LLKAALCLFFLTGTIQKSKEQKENQKTFEKVTTPHCSVHYRLSLVKLESFHWR